MQLKTEKFIKEETFEILLKYCEIIALNVNITNQLHNENKKLNNF